VRLISLFDIQVNKGFLFLYFKFEYYYYTKKKQKHFQNISLFSILTTKLQHFLLGLSVGFFKHLVLEGVGYKASFCSRYYVIFLKIGLSHPKNEKIPKGIQVLCSKETAIILKSSSKMVLGNFALRLTHLKKRDVYKNKGVLIKEEKPVKKKIRKK
jgi:ribosomal protein L6P/L9E